ncbi:MAG: hypothetical protein ABJA34_00085 [Pseudonocardiales bacterium]
MTATSAAPAQAGSREAPTAGGGPALGEVVPWLAVLAFGLQGLRPTTDSDLWWHLRTGEWIAAHHRLPAADQWSFASSRPWILHEWLSQLLLYAGYRAGGYSGVLILRSLALAAIAAVVVVQCRKRGSWLHTTIAALFGLATVEPGAAARPQLASFLLMAILGPALLEAARRGRPPLWLIPFMWLWASLHGLWTVGLALYACVAVGVALDGSRRNRKVFLRFAGVGAAMLAATALTPVGPRLLLSPFEVRGIAKYVTEWQPPHVTSLPSAAALLLVGIVLTAWARGSRRVPPYEVLYLFAAAFLAVAYLRTGPLAGVLLAPLAAQAMAELFAAPPEKRAWSRRHSAILTGAALLTCALGATVLAHQDPIRRPAPAAASQILDDLPGRARVLDQFELGNWMLWTARDASPAVDGRYEIFGPAYISRYVDTLNLHGDWRTFVADSQPDAAWLDVGVPLAGGLQHQLGWTVAWTDGRTVILLPPPGGDG